MGLRHLSIRQFRCFPAVDIELSPQINVVAGKNASGKTSILEAIFLLSRGRSFRTPQLETALRQGEEEFYLAATIANRASTVDVSLKRRNGLLQPTIASKSAATLGQLAALFPVQLLDGQTNMIIQGGAKYRRQFLDWGAFHVERLFHETWQKYHRALKQRNVLLKGNRRGDDLSAWDAELAQYGEQLGRIREQYLHDIYESILELTKQTLDGSAISIRYIRGWAEGSSLADSLLATSKRDRLLGTTSSGPHRADLAIQINGRPAQEIISRGQAKILAASLLLAQATFYQRQLGVSTTLLVDDLEAELDTEHLTVLLQRIREVGSQVILTTIEPHSMVTGSAAAMFHVKQGNCVKMI